MNKMKMESVDIRQKNIDKIAELFPGAITEKLDEKESTVDKQVYKKAINFDMLRQLLSEEEITGDEAYEFTWVGKKRAIIEANAPIRKTLRPCKEESKDWDSTENLYIEGDNLEVLKLLQESYLGKVKMIYIDPPYNTGNDFLYKDNFEISEELYGEQIQEFDEDNNRLFVNTSTRGRFHSDWCSMFFSRIFLAKNLLKDDGVIFISIDDREYKNVRSICDEVFGEVNFIATFIWEKRLNRENRKIVSTRHDYIIAYTKTSANPAKSISMLPMDEEALSRYSNPDNDPRGLWKSDPAHAQAGHGTKSQFYTLVAPNGNLHELPSGRCWVYNENVMKEAIEDNRIWFGKDGNGVPRIKTYLTAKDRGLTPETIWFAKSVGTNDSAKRDLTQLFDGVAIFETPKPIELIKMMLQICQDNESDMIVLDFFSGTATTAHATFLQNVEDRKTRKFILVQADEKCPQDSIAFKAGYKNICEIGKERIRRAGNKILNDNPEVKNIDTGFRVFKVDDSNMKDVYYAAGDYNQNILDILESNIKDDRTDLDLLFSCILEWGMPLSLPYVEEVIDGVKIHNVADGDLIACFEENINEDVVKRIASREQKPLRVVFRDSSFANSPAKINVEEIFKLLSPNTKIKVL